MDNLKTIGWAAAIWVGGFWLIFLYNIILKPFMRAVRDEFRNFED